MAKVKPPERLPQLDELQLRSDVKIPDWWPNITKVKKTILQVLQQETNRPLTTEEIDNYCQQYLAPTPETIAEPTIDDLVIIERLFDLIAAARTILVHQRRVQKTPQGWFLFGRKVIDLTSDETAQLVEAGGDPDDLIITRKFPDNGAGPVIVKIDLLPQQPQSEWANQANCRNYDSQLFFPNKAHLSEEFFIESVCFNCPVRIDCLEDALTCTYLVAGYWGGISYSRARSLAQERRQRLKEARFSF